MLPRARATRSSPPLLGALTILALLQATPARASDPVELRWDAPASCPAAAFHEPLQRYLGARSFAAPRPVRARLRATSPDRWQLDLTITGAAEATRRLTADRCETIADAAAFIVAQALTDAAAPPPPQAPPQGLIPTPPELPPDPSAPIATIPEPPTSPAIDPEPTPTPDPATPTIDRATQQPPPTAPPPPPRPLRVALRLGGGLSGGALPTVGGELAGLLGLLGPRWRVDLLVRGVLPTRARSTVDPTISARLGLWALGARACAVPRRAALEFPLCAGAEFGQVIARSDGLDRDGRAAVSWAAVTASPGLAWSPRPWLALVVSAQLAVAVIRHDFVVRGLPPLHSLGPVDAGAAFALEFRLPTRPRPGA